MSQVAGLEYLPPSDARFPSQVPYGSGPESRSRTSRRPRPRSCGDVTPAHVDVLLPTTRMSRSARPHRAPTGRVGSGPGRASVGSGGVPVRGAARCSDTVTAARARAPALGPDRNRGVEPTGRRRVTAITSRNPSGGDWARGQARRQMRRSRFYAADPSRSEAAAAAGSAIRAPRATHAPLPCARLRSGTFCASAAPCLRRWHRDGASHGLLAAVMAVRGGCGGRAQLCILLQCSLNPWSHVGQHSQQP
jgi:hypothetical protein